MSAYRITTDLFVLPYRNGDSILYAPLAGFVGVANEDMLNLLAALDNLASEALTPAQRAILEFLASKNVVNGRPSTALKLQHREELSPEKLALFPTDQCNLNCRYCYAGTSRRSAKTMDWDIATDAIEYFIALMKEEGRTTFPLELHGGGEPFFAWPLVQHLVAYAEARCSQEEFALKVFAATNGMLNDSQRKWILRHVTSLVVSFDGLPRVQDYQRAALNNNGSFAVVDASIKYLDRHNFPYAIRCAVSTYNEDWLDETVDFVTATYRTKLLFLEPVHLCGCTLAKRNSVAPDLHKFVENFKRLEPVCAARGLRLEYSGALFEKITPTFCYVGTDNFAITPDGYLTNCWEVTSAEHPLAGTFIFGHLLPGGKLAVDRDKLTYLRSLAVEQLEYCQNCFARWHCAGDCVARLTPGNYHGARGGERCMTNREIIAHRITQMLERENYYEPVRHRPASEDDDRSAPDMQRPFIAT